MEELLVISISVSALAIVMQMLILGGIFLQVKQLNERMTRTMTDLQTQLTPILGRLQVLIEDAQPRVASAASDAAEIIHIARQQAERIDRVFAEAVDRLRMQVIRADHILTGALEEIEEAGSQIKRSVVGPVQEATAFIRGIKAGLDFLRSRGRSPRSSRESVDEELFI